MAWANGRSDGVGIAAVVGVFVGWLLGSLRIWRVPGAEFEESPENNGYVGHDGIHGFGLPEGVVLRWEDVKHAWVRWYKGAPFAVLVKSDAHAVWLGAGCFGELGWLKEVLGTRLMERSEDPLEDAPAIPMPGSVPGWVASVALLPVAGWCGWIFWEAARSSGAYGMLSGIAVAVPLLLGDRITRLAGLTYVTLLLASLPLAAHVSPAALDAMVRNGWPIWQCVGAAAACYWYEWRTDGREGAKP